MYMYFRGRLLQRRRLRWFLIQARFRLFTIWEKLESFCPCIQRRVSENPDLVFSNDINLPLAQPMHSLVELRSQTLLSSPLLEFLKSSVPLVARPRSAKPKLLVCHDYKGGYQEDKWVQGKEGMEGYVLWQWHLVDVFVYFSHSLVTIPPPGWINAAHKHGVPVLGTFITEWAQGASVCRSLLATAESCCMFASRLAELASDLGFDGWLTVNRREKRESELTTAMRRNVDHLEDGTWRVVVLIDLFLEQADQHREPDWYEGYATSSSFRTAFATMYAFSVSQLLRHLVLLSRYDAVTERGELRWQNCLNEENRLFFGDSDGLFTNYSWSASEAQMSADAAGDRATDVYMGVDVFGRNTFGGGGFDCDIALKVALKAQVSAALFAPGWVSETDQPPSFEVASARWWRRIEDCWPLARCSPTQLPFFTDFSRGCGTRVSVEGNEVSTRPWFNLSCQSVQPILKVISHPPSLLAVDMSYEAAYSGGSCLRISVSDDALGVVQLYESSISVKATRLLHVSYSVQADDELHVCLALKLSREDSRFLVLLGEEVGYAEVPLGLPNCAIERSVAKPGGSSKWKLLEHKLDHGTCNIDQIYAVVYSGDLNVQKLLSLVEDCSKSSDTTGSKETRFAHVLLGHLRISTEPAHDRELPEIVFEGCEPEWTQKSEAWKSVSLTLRWGLVQSHEQTGGCQWVQYYVYASKDEESGGPGRPHREYLGVAVVQAFSIHDFQIPSSCNVLNFYVQAQCACGLPGSFSPACAVDVSHAKHDHRSSDSDPSQPLLV